MRQTGGNVYGSGGRCFLAAAVDNRVWNWWHRKKAQVGGKVCMQQRRQQAASEIENEGRGGRDVGRCFVFCCGVCQTWPAICYISYG
jgi:hypothetical protein